ncbi:MAG: bile acid:sodium symporter family protein [Myxococcota bacterium]
MESNVLTAVLLPIALGIVMLGLGLSLVLDDFRRVVVYPKAVLVGLICQTLLLPAVCYTIARGFGLAPELAVGLMLLAASPGGATANLFSHLAKGDVALNVTLTAVNSVLSLFTLPLIVGFAMQAFLGDARAIPMPFAKIIEVFVIVLVPMGIGMTIRAKAPGFAARSAKTVKILSAVVLFLVIGGTVLKARANLGDFFQQVGVPALVFNLVSMAVGYFAPRLLRIDERQSIAIGMEIGIHNGTLAIAIAGPTLLNNSTMAIPPAIYSLIMFFTAAAFGWVVNRRAAPAAAPVPSA